ncbi:hypothetical protein WT26_31465 [Burkholderia cepacia]|nr:MULTISPECIES: hypothetical protein [Burkholderia cepacia complex]AOK20288.1 hypothetical protein WT26_31465 [Burkholderia cepacia]
MSTYAQKWNVATPHGRILAVIVTVLAVSLLVTIAFLIWPSAIEKNIGNDEIFKLTYQFFLIVVLGGALSFGFSLLQYERTVRETERALQSQILREVVQAYNAAKKVRRLLRAKAVQCTDQAASSFIICQESYDKQMQVLVDIQLDFEAFKIRVENNPRIFPSDSGLAEVMNSIEQYLGNVVGEYEEYSWSFGGQSPTRPLTSLQHLHEFVMKFKRGGAFDMEFKKPFHKVVGALQDLIIK